MKPSAVVTIAMMLCLGNVPVPKLDAQQERTADLVAEVLQGPPPVTPPGSAGRVLLRLTNLGPDVVGPTPDGGTSLVLFSNPLLFWEFIGSPVSFSRVPSGGCYNLYWLTTDPAPGQPLTRDYTAEFLPLAPGESAVCELEYEVNPILEYEEFSNLTGNDILVTWRAFSPFVDDPNTANSIAGMVFRLSASPIPTADLRSLVLLGALLAGVALMVLRKAASSS